MPTTNTDLAKILAATLTREMTPEQKEAQRRSFVYGNTKIENDAITRDTVAQAAEQLSKHDVVDKGNGSSTGGRALRVPYDKGYAADRVALVLGENIQRAREAFGVSASELAAALGQSAQTVMAWERGVGCPIAQVVRISWALGCSVEQLVQDIGGT